MVDRPALSKGEMEVARVLWEVGPATVREVFESLPTNRAMDFSTVQTYLRRLETKGHANSRLDGRVRVYSARTRPRTIIRETVDDFVDRLFDGELMPMMRHLIRDRDVSEEEIVQLRAMLDQLSEGRDESDDG